MKKENYITASVVLYKNNIESLEGLKASIPFDQVRLVVVDNSPTDALKALFTSPGNIQYIHNGENIGFGRGHNLAFDNVKEWSLFHFILNPDVYFNSSVVGELVKFLESDESIGVVGPKIYYPNGDLQYSCRLLPTPFDLFVRRFAPSAYRNKRDERNELRFTEYNSKIDVPFLLGCFLGFRSKVFEEVGGFDERFFMYLEDTDLCRKVLEKYRVVFNPEVEIFHTYAKGSTKSVKLFKIHLRSSIKYFNKWGWFFDGRRTHMNNQTLKGLNVNL